MTSRPWAALILVLLLPLGSCAQAQTAPVSWEVSTPEQQGVDSEMLVEALRRVRDERLDVRSVILIRNDRVIFEAYVHPYDRETLHNVKSVSKSILSAVVGIALRDGILDDIDQPVSDFFPQHLPDDPTDAWNRITGSSRSDPSSWPARTTGTSQNSPKNVAVGNTTSRKLALARLSPHSNG